MNVRKLEYFVSNVLRIGVVASGVLILAGLGLFIATGDVCYPNGEASIHWILWGDPFFSPSHILFIGFLILVLTPLFRVLTSVFAYSVDRDWVYAGITAFVLTVLILGMILGLG